MSTEVVVMQHKRQPGPLPSAVRHLCLFRRAAGGGAAGIGTFTKLKGRSAGILALLVLTLFVSSPAQAWTLTAVVKTKDGNPTIIGYSFGTDRQACIAAMDAIKKMQPEAVIVQPCTPECPDKTC
jgi:hypothetical protein